MLIHKVLSSILINAFILYLVVKYLKIWFSVYPMSALNCEMVLILGGIFWLIYDIWLKIVKIIALPFSFFVFISNIFVLFLNIIWLYLFIYIVNNLDLWIHLQAISFNSIVLLSIILVIFNLIFKKF